MAERSTWKTMKKILDAIREEPRKVSGQNTDSPKPLTSIARDITRKTIYNHLGRLGKLGLVKNVKGMWYPAESIKEFRTKNDYEAALNHSKFIMSGSSWRQGMAHYSTYAILQEFSIGLSKEFDIHDRGCGIEFFAHLKTGYPYLYKKLKEGYDLLKEKGQFIKQIHKEVFGIDHSDLDDILINDAMSLQNPFSEYLIEKVHDEVTIGLRDKLNELNERLDNVLREIGGEIAVIFRKIEHGTPLRGYCDFCPNWDITTEDG